MKSVLVELRQVESVAKLECSACGAAGVASCNCNASYIPAKDRAVAAIAANPQKSNRALAKDLGVSHTSVNKARGNMFPPEKVIGRDGKQYPARKMPEKKEVAATDSRLAKSMVKHGWYQRAELAAQEARYAPLDTCPRDTKMREAAKEVIAAWTEVLNLCS